MIIIVNIFHKNLSSPIIGRCSIEINRFLHVNFSCHLVKSLGIRQYSYVFGFTANKISYPKTAFGT